MSIKIGFTMTLGIIFRLLVQIDRASCADWTWFKSIRANLLNEFFPESLICCEVRLNRKKILINLNQCWETNELLKAGAIWQIGESKPENLCRFNISWFFGNLKNYVIKPARIAPHYKKPAQNVCKARRGIPSCFFFFAVDCCCCSLRNFQMTRWGSWVAVFLTARENKKSRGWEPTHRAHGTLPTLGRDLHFFASWNYRPVPLTPPK